MKNSIKPTLAEADPKLSREWHTTRNAKLTPKDMAPYSHKKAWWACRNGHEWKARIASRNEGHGCPYCGLRRLGNGNNLQMVNPKLAREWHPARNAPLTPKDVAPFSQRKVWWMCKEGHEWDVAISIRSHGGGCPYCAGHMVTEENCIKTLAPWLARDWHPTKNGWRTPRNVAPHSQRQVWWKCRNGHERRERVVDRYKRGGCSVCIFKWTAPRLIKTV